MLSALGCEILIFQYKNNDRHDLKNCMPIFLLPSISKVLEKVVYICRSNQFDISPSITHFLQISIFRAERCTELALSELVDRIRKGAYRS